MEEKYACLHFDYFHDTRKLIGSFNHNFRLELSDNVDPTRTHLNRELVQLRENEKTYKDAYKRRLKEGGVVKVQKNNTLAMDVMMTYTHGAIPNDETLDRWVEANMQWLGERFGKDNIVSAVLHLDESTPHIHAIVVPVLDGKLASTKMFNAVRDERGGEPKEKAMRYVQDDYAERMQEFNLVRGTRYSPAKHEHIQFYTDLNESADRKLPEPMKGENIKDYAQRVANEQYAIQLASLKRIKKLEREINKLKGESKISPDIKSLMDEISVLSTELEKTKEELDKYASDAIKLRCIVAALKNDYPSAETREGDFGYLRELCEAGSLFLKGYSREEIDKIMSGEIEEKDIGKEEKEQ